MMIIAQRGPLLLLSRDGIDGRVYNRLTGNIGDRMAVAAILKFGYWVDPTMLVSDLSADVIAKI